MNRIGDNLHHFGGNEPLVRALIDNNVDFIVIGGLAIAWYCSERQADDMDLLIDPTAENSARLCVALKSQRVCGFDTSSFTKPSLQVPLKGQHYAELLTPLKGWPPFDELAADAVSAHLFQLPVRVASIRTLMFMKQCASAAAEALKAKHDRDIGYLCALSGWQRSVS
jgi:hypothetical protein